MNLKFVASGVAALAMLASAAAAQLVPHLPSVGSVLSPIEPLVETAARDGDVPAGRITGWRDLALAQRVPHAHDANETIPEQCACSHLRTSRLPHHASLQIDRPVAKRRARFVWFLHEAEPHARSLLADASNEVRSEVLHKAVAGPQRERSDEPFEIELLGRA